MSETSRSWLHLQAEHASTRLDDAVRQRDAFAACDVGWVEQMTPFLARDGDARGDPAVAEEDSDDWVIDPFAGFGTTLVAGWQLDRRVLGVECDAARCAAARTRLAAWGADERRQTMVQGSLSEPSTARAAAEGRRFGLCLTNIPYFGAPPLGVDVAGQLYGHVHYEPYLQGLRDVFVAVHELLRPGAWCVVMAQNLRLGDRFVPLAWDVARLLGERFELREERVLVYDRPANAPVGALDRPSNRAHEYALVCRKRSDPAVGLADGRALLAQLRDAGFAVTVVGSFARALAGHSDARPQDIDIECRGSDAELSRLARWLDAAGFRLESWNAPIGAPLSRAAMGHRHFVRARRIDAHGGFVQLDITFATGG